MQPSVRFTERGIRKRQHPASNSSLGENASLIPGENGQTASVITK